MELSQYLSMFIDESKEHLQSLNENLLSLESTPQDISIVHNIFRSAHTLKGMSATMGFEDIASLTHEMENVLDMVRNSKIEMNDFIFDCIFKSLDSLESMVEDIIQGGTGKADVTPIVVSLRSIVTGEYKIASTTVVAAVKEPAKGIEVDEFQFSILQQSIDAGFLVFYVEVNVNENCVLKAARAYMVFDALERMGEIVKATPSVQEIEQEKFDRSFSLYFISKVDHATLEKEILNVSEIESAVIITVDSESLVELSRPRSEVEAARQEIAAAVAAVEAPTPVAAVASTPIVAEPVAAAKPAAGGAPVASRTIRVDIERLDALMNLFSELLIDRVRLEQLASEVKRNDLTETVEHMSRVSSDLQNIVLKLRMVPVDSVFNRFPRMIRDLAKSLDKKVDLVITGAETELDRTVIDEIGDPLVHLLRNAVDHGIESISDRLAVGKSEHGTIQLRAFHSGNHVFIEIEEDGRGIYREKVLKTALKNGLVTAEQAAKLTDKEVYNLLFASGFSTAEKISDISGRGVGLDVVKTKIQMLGGHVQVDSKPGVGSKFSVQLPLTLSIISAMLVRLGSEKYAIPLSSIVETSAIQKSQIRNIHGNKMVDYRKSVIPLVSLSTLFEVPDFNEDLEEETEIVVVRKGDKQVALMVDEFIGQQEIVLKTLGKYLTGLFAISGATILGDGQVALIIDPNALIK
ncbi:chemotaxis protein CheA [Paenibacillus sp. CGMCC 1.16610]|uniref:Chemotaxis protein CheA n=1 Tax=Paenibacillus anseongense TaxID=2682845 RepID=A0ABW9UC56_9BACL|nr:MULTISPECIES: chemotaxis protein CheA [Paenibacillus]MBA2937817.1 chemotaxis protein CheA [Paenibacillus sp. CGMCC 1.16610]MVQ36875.1 chemotaxis protein CheA [Paenibacillus anseongense]